MSEWLESELGIIGTVVSGGTPSTTNAEYWDGEILFVTPFDLSKVSTAYIEKTARKITKAGLESSSANILPSGSIVISSRAPIGYVAIGNKEFTTNQGCKSIMLNDGFDSKFVYYSIIQNVDRIKKLGAGTTFTEISKSDLEKVKLPHPKDKKDQQHIARIIATCDAVIEKTQSAIAKYKAIKQGMMHDLFTRGIDVKTGKLRPRYEDAPELYKKSKLGWIPREWEVKRLEYTNIDIIDGDRGVNYPKENDLTDSGHCLFLSATNVTKDGFKFFTLQFISKERDELLGTGKLVREDIVVTTRGTIGNVIYYDNEVPYEHVRINSGMIILRNNDKEISNEYLYHFIKEVLFEIHYKDSVSGTAQPQLPIKDLKKLFIIYPSPDEQKLNTEKVKTINTTLQSEQTYLEKMQLLKKGLMEDLLSGRKRLNL